MRGAGTGTRGGPAIVGVLTLALLVLVFLPGHVAAALAILLVALMPAALLLLASRRRTVATPLAAAAVAAACVGGGFLVLLATRDDDPLGRWLAGLPLAAGVLVWVIALLTLVLLGLLFGLGWSRWRPTGETVERLRRLAAETDRDA